PWLDMDGAFFTIACKEGSSELWHLDFVDDGRLYALLFCVGPPGGWVGGDLDLAQLYARIPLGQGTLVAFLARNLVHRATAVTSG
ncbi:hypothetical protein PUNSTDRAFT_37406, partial [Punctularia strigosozonata HHB-11173 SS5]